MPPGHSNVGADLESAAGKPPSPEPTGPELLGRESFTVESSSVEGPVPEPQPTGRSRRQVLRAAVTVGAGVMFPAAVLNPTAAYAAQVAYDVVVVGSGAAGMTAA